MRSTLSPHDLSLPRKNFVSRLAALAGCAALLIAASWSTTAAAAAAASASSASAWSFNLGWHNPVQALIGFNAQYLGSTLGFEAGIGWADVEADEDRRKASLALLGDANMKYLFMAGWFRPYVELGVTFSNNYYLAKETGLDLTTGSAFFGGGAIVGSPNFYGYLSGLYWNGKPWTQFGLGYGF